MASQWRVRASLLSQLLMDLYRSNPWQASLTVCLMLFRCLSAGVGLLLILPLLQVIGIIQGHDAKVVAGLQAAFHALHVPMTLPAVLIIYVTLVSLIALAAFFEQIISTQLQHHYTHQLRALLFGQLLETQWPFFLKRTLPTLLHSLTVQVQSVAASNFQLLTLINGVILGVVYVVLSFFVSWPMTLVAMGCGLLLLCLMLPLHQLTSKSGEAHLQQNQSIFKLISEQLSALKMIKSAGIEEQFANSTLLASLSLAHQNQRLTHVTAATRFIYASGSVVVFSLLLYIAITFFAVPVGSLLLLLVIFSRLLPIVSSTQQGYQRLLHQLPAFSDIKQLLHDTKAHQEALHLHGSVLFQDAIRLKNVSFSYSAHHAPLVIKPLSMHIKKNTTTAIMGPSGVGKSTLADLIVGLLEPTSGSIFIDQARLDCFNKSAWRQSVAYVSQDIFLFNASIRHNLQLFCASATDAMLWAALRDASADFVGDLPEGLDTMVGDRGVCLSGGECQRLALARALLRQPQLLILDESTNALDHANIIKIQHALRQLHGKMTILIISHQQDMCDFADQTIHLQKRTTVCY
jgi:ATP-binding cassette subfamily C protein